MYKNNVKYLQGIHFSKFSVAERTEIKNLGRAAPELLISQVIAKQNKSVKAEHKLK
jgi:hypothetical protein